MEEGGKRLHQPAPRTNLNTKVAGDEKIFLSFRLNKPTFENWNKWGIQKKRKRVVGRSQGCPNNLGPTHFGFSPEQLSEVVVGGN